MPETRDRQLFVIGAGLGRTGTKNVKEPMELLYQKPCYHMKELLGTHEDHVELWSKLFDTLENNPKTKLSATALTTHQPQTIRFAQPIKSWGKLIPKQRRVTGCQEECLMGRINISTKKDRVPSLWRDRQSYTGYNRTLFIMLLTRNNLQKNSKLRADTLLQSILNATGREGVKDHFMKLSDCVTGVDLASG